MEKRKAAADIFKEQNMAYDIAAPAPAAEMDLEFARGDEVAEPMVQTPGNFTPKARKKESRSLGMSKPPIPPKPPVSFSGVKSSEEMQLEKEPIQVRETGRFFWRRIIVPPNAYVVHTRINKKEPVTLGLGVSFRFNPYKDAYMVIPAAMQTIGVVANCISKEKQGINILAYVQWQIHDFAVAYKKLDFSDRRDPLGIVNAQLREQAEAAIKDKIATMSVEEVLTDKAPIIEELTTRLREVTEGRSLEDGEAKEGLGIKIVTVQIREAIVSSQTLWSNLQSPFRHEKEQAARISYLNMTRDINQKELETQKEKEQKETETMVEIESLKQRKQTEAQEIRIQQEALRFKKEQEDKRHRLLLQEKNAMEQIESQRRIEHREKQLALEAAKEEFERETAKQIHELEENQKLQKINLEIEKEKIKIEIELERLKQGLRELMLENEEHVKELYLALELKRKDMQLQQEIVELKEHHQAEIIYENGLATVEQKRQEIRNLRNQNDILSQLVEQLPDIAAKMPEVKELKILQSGSGNETDAMINFIQKILFAFQDMNIFNNKLNETNE